MRDDRYDYNEDYDGYDGDGAGHRGSSGRRRFLDRLDDLGGESKERDADYGDDYAERPARRPASRRAVQRGRYEDDWSDDIDVRDGGSGRGAGRRPRGPERPVRRYADSYRDDAYDEDSYYDDDDMERTQEGKGGFIKRHPVLMNFVYIIAAGILLVTILMWFLDFWTFHGQERAVPDVKGQPYAVAASNIDVAGMRAEISDSVFDSYSRPGTVMEQVPIPGAKIKKGGTVYLTVVAFSPKLVTVPDFYNVSVRQARSMFEGIGIKEIKEQEVLSEYQGLVLGARFNGVSLEPGARIPVSAVITLEVGSGYGAAEETGADVDTQAIDAVIDELNIE